jgi:hypothetical protein
MIVNGVDLNTLAYNISTRTGRSRTPPRRGKNVQIASQHGDVQVPGKKYAGNSLVLPMWVIGADEDGNVPRDGSMRALMHHNLDRLLRIFGAPVVELLDPMPDGTVRRITGEVLDIIDPDIQAGGTRAQFSVTVQTWSAFWEDTSVVSAAKVGTGVWDVVAFEGATADMDDCIVEFIGPCTNPRLTSPSGIYVAYNAIFTGSQQMRINCADWSLDGTNMTESYIPGTGLDHGGDARWFVLEPGDPTPQCTFSQTAGTTGTAKLTGRRKWLVG